MIDIIAIGSSAFLPGFALAGIETLLSRKGEVLGDVRRQRGIVILEGELLSDLETSEREELKTSIDPVVVTLSATGTDEIAQLRQTIKSTMGVDLLK